MTTDKELEDWINEFKRKDLNLDDLRFFYCKGYNKAIDKFEKMIDEHILTDLQGNPLAQVRVLKELKQQLQELKEKR